MFGVLEFSEVWLIVVLLLLFGGGTAAYSKFKPSDAARMRRLEAKVDLILKHLGLTYEDPASAAGLSAEVRALADDTAKKIQAIALHGEQTGLGLKDAKDAVEAYIAQRG